MLRKCGRLVGVAGAMVLASVTLASSAPTMSAISFPVDTGSIVTVIVAAGATILLLWLGPSVGFRFVRKLAGKISRSAG